MFWDLLKLGALVAASFGLWWWFKGRHRQGLGGANRKYRTCPRCTASLRWEETRCDVCRWPEVQPVEDQPEQVYQALHRLLYRFRSLGILSETKFQELLRATGSLLTPDRETKHETPVENVAEAPAKTASDAAPAAVPLAPAAPLLPTMPSRPKPTEPAPVASRAKAYAAQRAAAMAEAVAAPSSPKKEKPKKENKEWGRLFQVFLEKNNILWGELVGGLMIVGCSIALVISFWAEISDRPLLKFGIFNGVVAALFAAGFYTDRRWKIHTTSHGVLIIAMLLVPLNFLAIAAFTDSSPPTDLLSLVGEGVSLVLFSVLTYFAARILTPHATWATAAGVMIPSLMQLLTRRFAGAESAFPLVLGLASVPVASYAACALVSLRRTLRSESDEPSLGEQRTSRHLILLGLCLFATLLPLTLLLYKTGNIANTLSQLAPLWVVLGAPTIATAIFFWRRIASELVTLRVMTASVGVLGGMMLLASMVLAWPIPAAIVTAAMVNAIVWIALARTANMPRVLGIAAAAMTFAWIVGAAVLSGDLTWTAADSQSLAASLFSANCGARLAPMVALFTAIAFGFRRPGWEEGFRAWGLSAAVVGAGSLALLFFFGFARVDDPANATWYFALYAALATAAAALLNHRVLSWAAAALLLVALVQGVVFRYGEGLQDVRAWSTALLAHASIVALLSAGAWFWREEKTAQFRRVLNLYALTTSAIAVGLLIGFGWKFHYNDLALCFVWLALVWLAVAWLLREARLFVAFQLALAAALGVAVTNMLSKQPWFAGASFDPWIAQAQGIALALSAIVWRALRLAGGKWLVTQSWMDDSDATAGQASSGTRQQVDFRTAPWDTFDRAAGIFVFVLTITLSAYAAIPGMGQELSPPVERGTRMAMPVESFELAGIASSHAAGAGGWGLLAATALLVLLGCWDRNASVRLLSLYPLGAAACLLAAASFSELTATASALRWLLGGFTLVAAVPILARRRVGPMLGSLGIQLEPPPRFIAESLPQAGRGTVVGLVAALYLAIAAFVCLACYRIGVTPSGTYELLVGCGLLALVASGGWLAMESYARYPREQQTSPALLSTGRSLLGLAAAAPLLVVSAFIVATNLTSRPLLGPGPSSWFAGLGNSLLYGGPLLLFALVLLGFAIRERSSGYALSFGLLMNGVATLVYLLELAANGRALDAVAWTQVAQLNAAVAAITSLGWWGAIAWKHGLCNADAPRPRLLQVLAALAMTFNAETLIAGCWGIFTDPTNLTWETTVASPQGLVAVTLAALALWVTTRPKAALLGAHHCGGLALLVVGLAACVAARFDTGAWEAYHSLLVASAIAGWVLACLPVRWISTPWVMLFASLTFILAWHGLDVGTAPIYWPWWSIAGFLSVYGLLIRLAWTNVRRWPIWLAFPALTLAGNVWWFEVVPQRGPTNELSNFMGFNTLLLGIAAIVSVLVEIAWSRSATIKNEVRHWSIGFHRFAVWFAIAGLLLADVVDLSFYGGASFVRFWWIGHVAVAITTAAAVATLWDPHVRWPVAAFYCIGLAAVGRFLAPLGLEGEMLTWAFALALGAFVLATSYLWNRRDAVAGTAIRLGAPEHLRERLDSQIWMLSANGLAIVVVVFLVGLIEFTHAEFTERMTSAYAILACALGLAFMAAGRAENVLRYIALATGALFAIAFGVAWISPAMPVANLHRLVAAAVALAAVIPIYSVLLVKIWRKPNAWTKAAQQTIPAIVGCAGVLLLVTLGTEVLCFAKGSKVPLEWPAVLAVALALGALATSSLAAALVPGRDPMNLSERGRTAYVYAAEVFLGLLFLHIRVTMPWLFGSWFAQFWPFIVMLIAFVGVGLSEWFARRKTNVLAEPLGNTGILLPLLPVISFWSAAEPGQYALLLTAAGALYTMMSVMRKSPLFAGLAALAFNGGLWQMLHTVDGWGMLQHPQLWLIPPFACVLIGAQLNRSRMTSAQLGSVRYACAVMIYAASTADIFINGVGAALWLPMVLAGLSLVGVFAGIFLRVRAFLFLGVAFLAVALFTVIWHAAVDLEQTYIWWIAGIVVGVAIIVLFGLFEKKRDEALALVENLKKWDA